VKLLVDTHLLLWAASQPSRLSPAARALLGDTGKQPYFSAACLWEIVIKGALGRRDFAVDASRLRRGLIDNGYLELPIAGTHTLAVASLPVVHRDPFDRIQIAQARIEGMLFLTSDVTLADYGEPVRVV